MHHDIPSGEVSEDLHLKVDSRVLIQLGSELVSDAKQALLELVKNAYDADAPGCKIEIDTESEISLTHIGDESLLAFTAESQGVNVSIEPLSPREDKTKEDKQPKRFCRKISAKGSLIVEDRGDGIPVEQLQSSWLVVSNSLKRNAGQGPKKTTTKGRTPLGDKGVGRLATMKLGDILLLESATSESSPIQQVYFRWGDCLPGKTLDQVPVVKTTLENTEKFKGTRLKVFGLSEPSYWKATSRINELVGDLARLISPFESVSKFPVTIALNGPPHHLAPITKNALSRALVTFEVKWSSETQTLTFTSKIKKRLFRGNKSEIATLFDTYVAQTDGSELFNCLRANRKLRGYNISLSTTDDWFIESSVEFKSTEIAANQEHHPFEDPGSFTAQINYFHFIREGENNVLEDEDKKKLRTTEFELLKKSTGIAVLRDGFRIPLNDDWLGIALEATKGSLYGLRAGNTIGYFALTGEHNYKLLEKSDREAFVQNDAYRGFMRLASRSAKFANDFLETLRREARKFLEEKKAHASAGKNQPKPRNFGESLHAVARTVDSVLSARKQIASAAERTRSSASQATLKVNTLKSDLIVDPKSLEIASTIASYLESAATDVERLLNDVDSLVERMRSDHLSVISIEEKFRLLNEQIGELYESAAVGLSARSLAHDIHAYISEITGASEKISNLLAKHQEQKTLVAPQLVSIKGATRELYNSVSLIDPMLPAQRTLRDTFSLKDFFQDYFEKRSSAYMNAGIAVKIDGDCDITIRANRGRLLQVVDNLSRNSQYWLTHTPMSAPRTIDVKLTNEGFVFSDSGPGIAPTVEDSLFELFVSDKPAPTQGGIGLFIVSQLLSAMGGSIILLPERNTAGRRYKFYVDLDGIIYQKA